MLHIEAQNALAALNLKHQLDHSDDTSGLLNQALEDVIFKFEKIGEAELKLADELKDILRRTRETLASTQDPQDPVWIASRRTGTPVQGQELSEVGQQEMPANIAVLREIEQQARGHEQDNANLAGPLRWRYQAIRVHKRLFESRRLGDSQTRLHAALSGIKHDVDEPYSETANSWAIRLSSSAASCPRNAQLPDSPPEPDADTRRLIQRLLVGEYLNESQGTCPSMTHNITERHSREDGNPVSSRLAEALDSGYR